MNAEGLKLALLQHRTVTYHDRLARNEITGMRVTGIMYRDAGRGHIRIQAELQDGITRCVMFCNPDQIELEESADDDNQGRTGTDQGDVRSRQPVAAAADHAGVEPGE